MAIANGTCVSFCNQPKAHFGLPWYALETIAVNVTWMKRGFNASQSMAAYTIYRQLFTSYSEILVRNCNFFPTPLHLTPPLGVFHWNSGKSLVLRKLESYGATRQWRQFDDRLSRFDTIPACDGQTDRRTDGQPISITCAVWPTHVKKSSCSRWVSRTCMCSSTFFCRMRWMRRFCYFVLGILD